MTVKRVVSKCLYALRYPWDIPATIFVVLIRFFIVQWVPVRVRPVDLALGHKVHVDTYLLSRIDDPLKMQSPGPIRIYRKKVLDGNGRILALQITDPYSEIEVLEGRTIWNRSY